MIDLGIHQPFDYVEEEKYIDDSIVYKLNAIALKLTVGLVYAKLIHTVTGAETNLSLNANSHTIGDDTVISTGISGAIPTTGSYFLELSVTSGAFSAVIYSDGVIQYENCTLEIQSKNSCSNQYYDWDNELLPTVVKIPQYSVIETTYTEEKTTKFTNNGKKDVILRQIKRIGFEFVGPTGWINELNGIKGNDTNSVKDFHNNVIGIKNIEIEYEKIDNGKYSTFTFTYEYDDYVEGNTCCEVLNIDDIANPDYTGGTGCGLFAVTIGEAAGVLTPTPTDAPVGTITYKWYLDGVYLSSSGTLNVTDAGNYKVEAKVGTCVVYSTYYIPNECALFQLHTSQANNDISATVSNIPDGESVTYSIKKDGIEVSATLPYTATVTGTYFVHATAGDCTQIQGVYVNIVVVVDDFTISITQADGILTAVTDATTPTYLWELEIYNSATGTSSTSTVGTAATQVLTNSGIYHLTITEGPDSKSDYYLFQGGMQVEITNANEFATGSGVVQVIDNTTGDSFEFVYQNIRWIVTRNGVVLDRVDVAQASLGVNEYNVSGGNILFGTSFPLTVNDVVEIKPV